MFDANANRAFEERDCVFGHELFQADEEASFEGDEALDRCGAAVLLVTDLYE